MKKLSVMFILLTLLLTGCGNKNTFDYDTELENLVNTYNSDKQCFADDYKEYLINNSSYRKLFNVIFNTSNIAIRMENKREQQMDGIRQKSRF